MDMNTIAVILYILFTVLLVVYMWRIEALIKKREEDLMAIHNAIKQLNRNQKLFIKPGEPVIIYRQEEKFHE